MDNTIKKMLSKLGANLKLNQVKSIRLSISNNIPTFQAVGILFDREEVNKFINAFKNQEFVNVEPSYIGKIMQIDITPPPLITAKIVVEGEI